jgi:hypothetical protein
MKLETLREKLPQGSTIYTTTERESSRIRWVDMYVILDGRLHRLYVEELQEYFGFDADKGYCVGGTGFSAPHEVVRALSQVVGNAPEYYQFDNFKSF